MINQIILSTNDDPRYVGFWPFVAQAYNKMFPDVKVHLAYLTERSLNDEQVQEFQLYGDVTLFKPNYEFPQFGQAKMIRFLLASQQGDDICYIDDIDLFPLRKDFITDKTDARPKDRLLCVGGEVYHHGGTYPVSQMTAEGYIWKQFINPGDMNFIQLLEHWSREPKHEPHENLNQLNDFANNLYFSDERLMRRLIEENPVPKFEMERGYENILDSTLDRMDWKVDEGKLMNHGYHNAHCGRPCDPRDMELLVKYVNETYG